MTVYELLQICEHLIAKGYGKKNCYTPNDDEGNGCHIMWNSVLYNLDDIEEFDYNEEIKDRANSVIIG